MKFTIPHRFTGAAVFEADIDCSEDTSYRVKLGLAVRAAVKADANLSRAYLADAYLADAYLADANLADANLADAYLADAYLADANLADANLADANLADANLGGAQWRDGITINRAPIQICNLDGDWTVYILDEHMQIGCELHSFDEWAGFDDRRILRMCSKGALTFWRRYGPALLAMCEARRRSDRVQAGAST